MYTQWDVRTTNYQFKLAQEQGENLLTAQNMFQWTGASERQWVINSRPSRGWDPYLGEYMEWPLEFEEVQIYENARHVVIKESKSQAVDIIQSISNLIVYGEGMGFRDRAFEELFLMFVKEELPEALSGVQW